MSTEPRTGPSWSRRLLVGGIIVVAVLLGGLIASATIPRWWAQRIGDQVDGSIVAGTFIGLFYGFVFTALPLLVLAAVVRWRRTWRAIAMGIAFALLLAVPNLMTLGIVVGRGNAAHAGERILDVEAPAFRGASLVGALIALGMAAFVTYLLVSRGRARRAPTRLEERE
ncbi:MAG: permease [Actinobacteria bacterium]|nr:permease [Actinomycetota bacterium]